MAEARVEIDYAGRPITRKPITAADWVIEETMGDEVRTTLPDGRKVWDCWDGTFLAHPETGEPDRSQRVDHQWPTVEEMLAEADARRSQ